MSTDSNFLSAAPLAFVLILPVFVYYCLRTIFIKQDSEPTSYTFQTQIPQYLIKQYVDKTRPFRKQYKKHTKKQIDLRIKPNSMQTHRKTISQKTLKILSNCQAGLTKYQQVNNHIKIKNSLTQRFNEPIKHIQSHVKIRQNFQSTILTTIYEDMAY